MQKDQKEYQELTKRIDSSYIKVFLDRNKDVVDTMIIMIFMKKAPKVSKNRK